MKRALSLLLILALVIALTACGGGSGEPSGGSDDSDGGAKKDSVTIQLFAEPTDVDAVMNGTIEATFLIDQFYGKLVTFGENGEIIPELAESWEFNDDNTQLTLKLRDGIKFSDGSDITSADVKYSFMDDNARATTYLEYLESVDTPDDKTVVLNLKAPFTSQLNNLACFKCSIYPEGSKEAVNPAEGATAYSGPYVLDTWTKGESIVLTKNPYWYDADKVEINTVKFIFLGDENSALIALESGEVDAGLMINTSANVLETAEASGELSYSTIDAANIICLMPNFNMPELADENVRHAIDCALNREDILSVAKIGTLAGNFYAKPYFGTDYIEGIEDKPQDIEKAKEYMAASAYPNGFDVELTTTSTWANVAAVVQDQLSAIGINVIIKEMDLPTLVANVINNKNYQLSWMSVSNMVNDMSGFVELYSPTAVLHMNCDPDSTTYDLLNKGFALAGDERHAAMEEAAAYTEEHLPYIGLYWQDSRIVYNKNLTVGPVTAAGYDCASMHWAE